MKIKCMIDKTKYNKKPEGKQIGIIQNNLKAIEIDIEELAKLLSEGCSFRPALLDGKSNKDWISQQIIALDFDNNTTINEELNRCKELKIFPSFGYTSFSHTEYKHKFRLVFVFDKVINDIEVRNRIETMFKNLFTKADQQTFHAGRLFFGGKELIYNEYNILNLDNLLKTEIKINDEERVNNILSEYNNSSNILVTLSHLDLEVDEMYNIKALQNRDVQYLKNKFDREFIEFENDGDFWEYLYTQIDMGKLLELKYPNSFRCLFHDDNKPSASIFQNDEGVWLYKCHSGSCNVAMNIKQLIETIGGFKSEHKALKFIKEIFNLSIKETEWSIEQKTNLESILHSLNMGYFADICPQTNKNIRYVKDLFRVFIGIAKENVYGENYMNDDGDVVFFTSLNQISKRMNMTDSNLNRISQRISVLVYHDLIRKLDDCKIPHDMLKKAQALSIEKNQAKRINFYAIPSWVFQQLKIIESQGIKWKEKGYTIKGASYEMYYRGEGKDVAQKIYPQHKKIKTQIIDYETGEITKTIIQDRTTTKSSQDRVSIICGIINCLLEEKGYTTEQELILNLSKRYNWNVTEIQLKKMRGELKSYGYNRIRANKQIKEQFGIIRNGYPFIIVKN